MKSWWNNDNIIVEGTIGSFTIIANAFRFWINFYELDDLDSNK